MGIPRPIVEFFGAIVGVDPDDYPKGDEDAMRAYAARYDAIAADLRAQVGGQAQQAASSIAEAWNGEGGRALAQQLRIYVTSQESGGIEAIAKNAEMLAQYLRDQADTIARTKVMIWAQVALGIAMFGLPAGRLVSAVVKAGLRKLLREFIKNRAKETLAKGAAQALANKAKVGAGAKIKALAPGFFRGAGIGAAGAGLFGLGPNTAAQVYGLATDQDGRGEIDDKGEYQHDEGWNWEDTRTYAKITAWAIPVAAVTGAGMAGLGRVATSKVGALNTQAWGWAGRRVSGAAAMTTSLPIAEKIVTGHNPTMEGLLRTAVMGAAMPSHPFRAPESAPPGGHPDTTPVEAIETRNHTKTEGGESKPLPPDPPNPPELAVKPDATSQTTTAPESVHVESEAPLQGAVGQGAAAQPAARTADVGAPARSTVKTPTVESTPAPKTATESITTKQPAVAAEPTTKPTPKPEPAEITPNRPTPSEPKNTPQPVAKSPTQHGETAPRTPETETGRQAHHPETEHRTPDAEPGAGQRSRESHDDGADAAGRRTGAELADGEAARPVGDGGAGKGVERLEGVDVEGRVGDAQKHVEVAQQRVAAEEARLARAREDGSSTEESQRRLDHNKAVASKADEALAAELKLAKAVEIRDNLRAGTTPHDAPRAETAARDARSIPKELEAAERAVAKQEEVVRKAQRELDEAAGREATRRTEKAARVAHERTETRQHQLEEAHNHLAELKTRLDEVNLRLAEERVQDVWAEAEAKRLSRMAAELDRTLARLNLDQLTRLFEGRLDGWEHFTPDEGRFLAIHEMIHRTTSGWGYALQWTQIKADLVLRSDRLAEMYTGEGKTAVGVLALGLIAAEHPVHFMTSSRTLADSNHSQFRKILEPLGVEVRRVDPNRPEADPVRPTVYVGDVAAFGWSKGRGHPVPGKHAVVDEIDAVAIELATQVYTHSDGASGRASAKTRAEVRLVRRAFESGVLDHADFVHSERGTRELTPDGRQKLAEYVADHSGRREFGDLGYRAEAEAQARWGLHERRDYILAKINGEERILIVSKHTGEPLIDPETLLEQRWNAVAQALEAKHGLKLRADPNHTNAVTTHELLKSYDHLSGMSGTAKLAEQGIRDLYGADRVVEIERFNERKLTERPDQHFETSEAKWRAIVEETVAGLTKDNRDPQAIITEHNDEVALVERLLTERLAELKLGREFEIQAVDAERMASFIDKGTFNESMSAVWEQAGQPGTITIGNKVLGRGIDIVPDAAAFRGKPREAGANVYTIKGTNLEAVDGGLTVRVAFRDADSPRGTIQAINRAGRQGAPGEATVYTSHEDQLFRNRPDALEAALVYQDRPATAARDSALRTYTAAAIAHAQATSAAHTQQTAEALRQAQEALRLAEKELAGTHETYHQQIVAAQSQAQTTTIQEIQARESPEQVAHTTAPDRTADEPVDLGELKDLPPKLSSAGKEGRLASEDAHAGAYRITGPDGKEWVVKLYPEQGINAERVEVEFEGLRGGELTGFGPASYGRVRATIEGEPYVGVAMEPVEGGLIEADVPDPAAVREAEHWSERVTLDTVDQLDLFGRRLLEHGYSIRRDLEFFVDADGNFRPIDLAGVERLPEDTFYREFWITRHEEILTERRVPLTEIAIKNAAQREDDVPGAPLIPDPMERPSASWEQATDLGELQSLPQRLSSAGETGFVATIDEHSGAYRLQRPDGTDWVVKLYPDNARQRDHAVAEIEGIHAAALTGYGPTPYGLVRATVEQKPYVGVAMAFVEGGHISARSDDPSAVAEAARWRSAATFDTVCQLDEYLSRLNDRGYYYPLELQFFVDDKGNLRPIDLEFVTKLPEESAARQSAIDNAWLSITSVRGQLIDAVTENTHREPPVTQQPHSSPAGLPVAEVEGVAAEVRAGLRVSELVEVRVVADRAGLEAVGFAPEGAVAGVYSSDGGRHVVYLVADQLGSECEVVETIHHELQHGGLRVLSEAEHDRVLAWLIEQYDDPRVAPYFGELTDAELELLDRGKNGPELSADEHAHVRELAEHAYIEFALTVPQTGPVRMLWHGFLSNVLGPALWKSRVWPRTVGIALLHDTARRIAIAMQTGEAPRQGADTDPHYRAPGPSRGGQRLTEELAQRWQRYIDGIPLSGLPTSIYTALPGAVSAFALAGSGQLGLAAAVLGGTALAWPAHALTNRYAEAADRRAKVARSNYWRLLEDRVTSRRQAAGTVRSRAPFAPADLTVPRSTAPWWTFALRNAVPAAAALIPLAIVVPPAVVGVAVGLGAAVVGSAQYGLHRRRARLDDVRRAGDYGERSARPVADNSRPAPHQLLEELTRLDGERVRLESSLDDGDHGIAPLAGVLVAISAALSQYAAVLERQGLDPHARLAGPTGELVSDSVLHRDPLHARNLADLIWAPGRHHRPGVEAENIALIAAKIAQTTSGYGPVTAALIRSKAEETSPGLRGRRLVDIAAELIYDLELRRTPSWMARDTRHTRALRAKVDFYRRLTAEYAEAVPARLTWLAQSGQQPNVPVPPATITVPETQLPAVAVPDDGKGLRAKALTDRAEAIVEAVRAGGASTGLISQLDKQLSAVIDGVGKRLEAKRASVKASETALEEAHQKLAKDAEAQDSGRHARRRAAAQDAAKAVVTRDRHARVAASYEEALQQLEAAKAGYLAIQSATSLDGLEAQAREAADQVSGYLDTMAKIAPPDLTLATGMATGWLPHLAALTEEINKILGAQGIKQQFTADQLQSLLLAEFGQLAGRDGAVLPVGHGAGELRIRLRTDGLTEVLDPPAKTSETMVGQLPQGGRSLSTTATSKIGVESGFNLAKVLAAAPEGSWLRWVGEQLIVKLGWSGGWTRAVTANASEYALGGGVEDNRDESVLFSGPAAWELEVRTGRSGWLSAGIVNTGAPRYESELKLHVAHSYTVPAPEQTVQLPARERDPKLPEHVISGISGLEAISDRVQGLVEAGLGTVVRDQIHTAITRDLPGELRESTGPGLIRPLLVDGEVVGHLELSSEVRSVELVGTDSWEHWQEALRVGFSGASGNQSFGHGRSLSFEGGFAGLAGADLFGIGLDIKPPTFGFSRRTGWSASQSAGGVGIHVGVQRFTGPTQGYRTVIQHKVKVVLSNEPVTVVKGNSEALLRLKVNEAYRHGFPIDPKALRKKANGDPVLIDERQFVEGDLLPDATAPGRLLEFPEWAKEWGGAGPWAVQDFTGGAEALREVMRYLSDKGYLPPLDVDGVPDLSRLAANPVERHGQLANLTEVRAQFSALRLETGYDIAAQTGLEFTVVRTRPGRAIESLTLRIDLEREFENAEPRGVTTSESVVILNIGSNTAGRSGGGSTAVGLAAKAGAQLGSMARFWKAGYSREWTLGGRSAGWSSGGTVNQVTLVESTSPVAVFHVPHTLTVTEVGSGHKVHRNTEGSARVSMDSDFLPYAEMPAGPSPVAIKGEVTSGILDRAILLGLSAGELQELLPAAIVADPTARRHVAAFLNPRNLIAHPEWTQTPYRTRTVVRGVAHKGDDLVRGGVVPRVAGVSVEGKLQDAELVVVTDGVSGDINFAMGSHGSDRGTNSGSSYGGTLGGGIGGRVGELGVNRSSSESQSSNSLQIWGDERLTIEVGRHYVFKASVDFELAVTDGPMIGNLQGPASVKSSSGMALFQLPERDALRFYAGRELELPLHQVADAVERFVTGNLSIDRRTLTSLVRRYAVALRTAAAEGEPVPTLAKRHTEQLLTAELAKAVGLEVAAQNLDEVLEQAELVVDTIQLVSLPAQHETTTGDSLVESAELRDADGLPVRLLDRVTQLVSKVLGYPAESDPVLVDSLFVDLAGKRWWGRIVDMLDPGGFVRSYLAVSPDGVQQKITVRIRARFLKGTAQTLGETTDAIGLWQDYGYDDKSQAEGRGQSTGAGGNYAPGHGESGSVGTDRSGGVRAASGTQLTEIKRKGSFGAMARILRRLSLEVEVTREPVETPGSPRATAETAVGRVTDALNTHRNLGEVVGVVREVVGFAGEVVQLIPAAIVGHGVFAPEAGGKPVDHRRAGLPSNYKVEGTVVTGPVDARSNKLVDALAEALGSRRLLGPLGVRLHRVDLENLFSASARQAMFHSMVSEGGHRVVPLPVPGHPRHTVEITVRADVFDAELVAGPTPDSEIGQVNRIQHTTSVAVNRGRLLPLAGGMSTGGAKGSVLDKAALNGGVSVAEQVGDRVSDTSGVRRERSRFESGADTVIVRVKVGYDLRLERKELLPDGGERVVTTIDETGAAMGEAYLTMFSHQYEAMIAQQQAGMFEPASWNLALAYPKVRQWVTVDPREPSRVLTDALTRAREHGIEVLLMVTDAEGKDRQYLATPDGRLIGERDGGFAAAFATVHPRLVGLAEKSGIDLRGLYESRSTDQTFTSAVEAALAALGVEDVQPAPHFPTKERPGQTEHSHQTTGPSIPPVLPAGDGGGSGNAAALGRMATTEGRTQDRTTDVEQSVHGLLTGELIDLAELARVAGLDRIEPTERAGSTGASGWRVWRGGRSHDVEFRVGAVAGHALAGFAPTPDGAGTTVTVSPLLLGDAEVLSAVGHELREITELSTGGPDVFVPGPARGDGGLPSAHDRGREAQLALLGWVAERVPESESAVGVRADLALLDAVTHLGLLPGTEGAEERLVLLDPTIAARLRGWMSRVTDDAEPVVDHKATAVDRVLDALLAASRSDQPAMETAMAVAQDALALAMLSDAPQPLSEELVATARAEAQERVTSVVNAPRVNFEPEQAIELVTEVLSTWPESLSPEPTPAATVANSNDAVAMRQAVAALTAAFLAGQDERPAAIAAAADRLVATRATSDGTDQGAVAALEHAMDVNLGPDEQLARQTAEEAVAALARDLLASSARDRAASARWIRLVVEAATQTWSTTNPAHAEGAAAETARQIASFWSGDRSLTDVASLLVWASTTLSPTIPDAPRATLRAALAAAPAAVLRTAGQLAPGDIQDAAQRALYALQGSHRSRQAAARATDALAAVLRIRGAEYLRAAHLRATEAVAGAIDERRPVPARRAIEVVQDERATWTITNPADATDDVRAARPAEPARGGMTTTEATKALLAVQSSVGISLGAMGVVGNLAELAAQYPGIRPDEVADGIYVGDYLGRPTTVVIAESQLDESTFRQRVLNQLVSEYGFDLVLWGCPEGTGKPGWWEGNGRSGRYDFLIFFQAHVNSGTIAAQPPGQSLTKLLTGRLKPLAVRTGLLPATATLPELQELALQIARAYQLARVRADALDLARRAADSVRWRMEDSWMLHQGETTAGLRRFAIESVARMVATWAAYLGIEAPAIGAAMQNGSFALSRAVDLMFSFIAAGKGRDDTGEIRDALAMGLLAVAGVRSIGPRHYAETSSRLTEALAASHKPEFSAREKAAGTWVKALPVWTPRGAERVADGWVAGWVTENAAMVVRAGIGVEAARYGVGLSGQHFVVTVGQGWLPDGVPATVAFAPGSLDPVITVSDRLGSEQDRRSAVRCAWLELAAAAALVAAVPAHSGWKRRGIRRPTGEDPALAALLRAMVHRRHADVTPAMRVEAELVVRAFYAARKDQVGEQDYETSLRLAAEVVRETLDSL